MLRPPRGPVLPIASPHIAVTPSSNVSYRGATPDVIDVGWLFIAIRRHWQRIAIGVIAGVALAFIYTRLATPQYEATATVRIDARQNTLPTIYTEQTARDEVFTEIEVLRSRTIAADVVDSLGLQLDVVSPRKVARSALFSQLKLVNSSDTGTFRLIRRSDNRYAVEGAPPTIIVGRPATVHGVQFTLDKNATQYGTIEMRVAPREEAIALLRKEVDVGRAGLQASIIALTYASEDPKIARDVLNTWTSSFIRRRQTIQRTEATSTAAFIQSQLDTLSSELARSEDRLLRFRNDNHVVSPEYEANTQVTHYAQLQADRSAMAAERDALSQIMNRTRTAAASSTADAPSSYRQLIGFPTLLRNQAASELLRSLSSLDDQRTALLSRRTAQDPDVVVISDRIRTVEGQLQALAATYLRGLTAQVEAADASLATYASKLNAIPTQQVEYARLQRAPRVLDEMVSLLQTRLKEAQITEAVKDPSVRIVDAAVAPIKPTSPNPPLALAFGLIGGLAVGVGMAFWKEHRAHAVHTRLDLQQIGDTPVLGLIPRFNVQSESRLFRNASAGAASAIRGAMPLALTPVKESSPANLAANEAYSRLYLNLQWAANRRLRTLIVTSPLPGDGKTTSVTQLAAAATRYQQRVLIIDADLRCGGLTKSLTLAGSAGLANLLAGTSVLREVVRQVEVAPSITVDVVSAGTHAIDTAVPLGVQRLEELLRDTTGYDLVLIDTPPVNVVADAAAIAGLADGILLIARAGATVPAALQVALEQLQRAGGRVLGTMLNDADIARDEGYGNLEYYRPYTLAHA